MDYNLQEEIGKALDSLLEDTEFRLMIVSIFGEEELIKLLPKDSVLDYVSNYIEDGKISIYDIVDEDVINDEWLENHDIMDFVDWDSILEQVSMGYAIDDVFSEDEIKDYAINAYYEDFKADALEEIKEDYEPEDVFTDERLAEWAENNGYVLEK